MNRMNRRANAVHNGIYEKLWYVVKDAVQAGIRPADFKAELIDCWREAHNELANDAVEELTRSEGR